LGHKGEKGEVTPAMILAVLCAWLLLSSRKAKEKEESRELKTGNPSC
jgi:hypothetical protein